MAQLNVALIGYAFMGRAHSNAYRQVGRFFTPKYLPRMKVLCGRTPAAVKTAADQLGWEETSTDWREVVRRKDIDIVDIVTPGDSHAEIAIEAAKAGKVVFCEKPLANTVKESERMLAAVKKAGVIHMICHNYRKAPAVTLAKQSADSREAARAAAQAAEKSGAAVIVTDLPADWTLAVVDAVKLPVINIGDVFTTGPTEAAYVIDELVKPNSVIPSHANEVATKSGQVIAGSRTETFMKAVKVPAHVPLSGKTMSFDGSGKCASGC